MTTNVFSLLIVLGVLVFFHELGHFLVARFFGVGVEKFSLGFGPKIIGKKIGLTEYLISAIPLGGYVKMVGEEPDSELESEMLPYSFTHKSVYKRMLIVAAGPVFNILLAIAIFWGIYSFHGTYDVDAVVGEVIENFPAYHAGFQAEDRIIEVNGQPINNWDEMAEYITQSGGNEVTIVIDRNNDKIVTKLKPKIETSKNLFGEDIKKFMIGVAPSGKMIHKPLNKNILYFSLLLQATIGRNIFLFTFLSSYMRIYSL